MQSGGQFEQIPDPSGFGQSGPAQVVVELDVLVEGPRHIRDAAEEGGMLTEGRLYVGALEHRLIRLAHEMRTGILRGFEELQGAHVHRMFARLADQEQRVHR